MGIGELRVVGASGIVKLFTFHAVQLSAFPYSLFTCHFLLPAFHFSLFTFLCPSRSSFPASARKLQCTAVCWNEIFQDRFR